MAAVALHLYDSATRSLRAFVPLEPGKASIYLCGATVQAPPHIGHVRSGVNFDILRRWLAHNGYEVTFVRNVTDIDDKILTKSADNDRAWWAWAYTNELNFDAAYNVLGCLPPTYEPRATGHVTEMIELMQRLIDSGHAYAAGGDVFFDVASWPSYGALSGQRAGEMQPAGDSAGEARKRDSRDFALWKGHKPGEPQTASWPTPWGRGRPGWHLECSAMATRYLGPAFDIHGGGLDLVFPHHENELAQSRAAGDGFAQTWMHNGLLNLAGAKMSKSVGNTLLVSEVVTQWRPVEVRYYLGAAHYRSAVDYSPEAMDEAAAAYRGIENFVRRAGEYLAADGDYGLSADVPGEFATTMDDDLGVPQALAVVHNTVRAGNNALAAGDRTGVHGSLSAVHAMTAILGISPLHWASHADSDLAPVVDALVHVAMEQRTAARGRKDYAAADAIRDQLSAAGIVVEDTPSGPRWTIKETKNSGR